MEGTSSQLELLVTEFFKRYEAEFNNALQVPPLLNLKAIVGSFASYFVGASPRGVRGGRNGLFFKLIIRQGYKFYRKIGTKSMKVKSLEVSQLDDYHVMVKVCWASLYTLKNGQQEVIEFSSWYLVQILENSPKIFAFITGDETAVLKQHRII